MIKALIEIGKSVRDLYPMPLVEMPYQLDKLKKEPVVLVVEMKNTGGGLIVENIYTSKYSKEDVYFKYFFRQPPSSNGPASSLSFKFPGKPSALRQRLKILNLLGYFVDIEQVAKAIESKIKDLVDTGSLGKNVPMLVVFKIDGKWPAENESLKKAFTKNFLDNLGKRGKRPVWKVDGVCHGCGKETTVYGGVGNLLKFYTVDKHGYAPEINPRVAWKQYALCEECIFDLERGKRAIDDFLTWNFYGKDFWLLPVTIGDLRKVIDRFRTFHQRISGKTHTEGYEALEDRLLDEASRQHQVYSYHFVFTRKENQAFQIILHIEEVLPSLLREYVAIKRETEDKFKDSIFEAIPLKDRIKFNFFTSNNLRATSQKPGFQDTDFYMLVDKVFRRAPVDERYLVKKAMLRISSDMQEDSEKTGRIPLWSILETLLSLEFLLKWGILKRKTGGNIMGNSPYGEFFDKHDGFFNHPAKRGLVLLGVLVQNFLNYQYKERGSTPFIKVLKNLRLNQEDVKKVYVALQNKMNEYGIGHWWGKLREFVGLSFIEAGDNWPLSPEEVGFYIAIGMALHSHPVFSEKRENESNEVV